MSKTKTESQVKIKYRVGGSENQFIYWDLWKADGVTRLPVADGGWNGVKGTRKQAEKEAQHHARLAEQKLERKKS